MKRMRVFSLLVGTLLLLVPVTASANAATQLAATSQLSHVSRMNCGGGTSGDVNVTATTTFAKFVGNKDWGSARGPKGGIIYSISINGKLYGGSRGTSTLRVKYTYCGQEKDDLVASAGTNQTVTVAKNPWVVNGIGGYSNVKLYVCNTYVSYHCGSEV